MSIKIQVRNNRAFSQRRRKTFPYDAKMSKTWQEPQSSDTFGVMRGWTAGATMANLPFSIFAVFNKGFFSPFSLPPSLPLAWGAACGPPDAYRQMSLVEQNTLCLTSQAATGLWRKLKGCLPCKDHSMKARPLVWVGLSLTLPLESFWSNRTQWGAFQYVDVTYATFGKCSSFSRPHRVHAL